MRKIFSHELKQTIIKHNLYAKKSLGQNYILDMNLNFKIASLVGTPEAHDILEIGPGPGGLTKALLSLGARKLISVEIDKRFVPALEEIRTKYPSRLEIISADILKYHIRPHLKQPIKIIGNLPYNIATEILMKFLTNSPWPPYWKSLTFMFQKEVAERITSSHSCKKYGRLSIFAQRKTTIVNELNLPGSCFEPKPKVSSTLLTFTPISKPIFVGDEELMAKIVKQAFNQRRKMLRQSLKPVSKDIQTILEKCNIDPTNRAENLTVQDYCALSNAILSHKK